MDGSFHTVGVQDGRRAGPPYRTRPCEPPGREGTPIDSRTKICTGTGWDSDLRRGTDWSGDRTTLGSGDGTWKGWKEFRVGRGRGVGRSGRTGRRHVTAKKERDGFVETPVNEP